MPAKRKDISNEEVRFMYEVKGMTQKEIAEHYGVWESTIYYRLHPEENRERSRKWRLEHPEYIKEYLKNYYDDNRELILEQKKEHYENNRDKILEQKKEHSQTENGKKIHLKHSIINQSKRRGLGHNRLNDSFVGGEDHHVNFNYVICIPAEIHRSIRHNVFTGEGMEAINKEAFEFLEWEMKEKQWEGITGDWMVGEY